MRPRIIQNSIVSLMLIVLVLFPGQSTVFAAEGVYQPKSTHIGGAERLVQVAVVTPKIPDLIVQNSPANPQDARCAFGQSITQGLPFGVQEAQSAHYLAIPADCLTMRVASVPPVAALSPVYFPNVHYSLVVTHIKSFIERYNPLNGYSVQAPVVSVPVFAFMISLGIGVKLLRRKYIILKQSIGHAMPSFKKYIILNC
jgi:hypothetical protein